MAEQSKTGEGEVIVGLVLAAIIIAWQLGDIGIALEHVAEALQAVAKAVQGG